MSVSPAASLPRIGDDEAADRRKLRRFHVLETVGGDNRRRRKQNVFSERPVRPVRLHLLAVGTERGHADENLRGVCYVLGRAEQG